ncbi:fibronectin type III domain-containing protein [Nonomuraea gerenzanensis]|uniref:fibronectin type III domain-containing protein n=1 Tax=Nonomuraea gerenzanensis TaxID=93944 RepID=UPI0029812645|nr:fibronectin type III domain-containing protein [Nonomuraea gerenzanensis]
MLAALTAVAAALLPAAQAWALAPVPGGVPPRPAAPASPDPSLQAHPLAAAPAPLDNPLKGFARFYWPGSDQNTGYPHSLTWSYFGLSEVMTDPADCSKINWSILDSALNEIASYGNQAAVRFYMEYPDGSGTHPANAIPRCFDGHVPYRTNTRWGTTSPDYDNPYLLDALDDFIAAFGARYDGDPRIGFIHLGLIGLWGEWHTWPYDTDTSGDSYPNHMPTDAHAAQLLRAYDAAFDETKLELRYPDSAGGAATGLDLGYHDDSFCFREGSPLAGVTLPQSLGGAGWAQLQRALNVGAENKWITSSMGGEVRPEIQTSAFASWPGGSGQVDNMKACIELEHTTWKINEQSQGYAADDPDVAAAVRLMGYDLTVDNAYFKNTASGATNVGVRISNHGVAPFYYPWTVTLGLRDSAGTVVKTFDTPWDLRTVMPLKIRAFPDWGVGQDPAYRDYGYPQYFQTGVNLSGVPNGGYQWVMRVRSPLETVSANAKKLRFANATQGADGWLTLGQVTVGSGGGTDTTPPAAPTGLTSPSRTSGSVTLSWTAATDNVGVAGYRVHRGSTEVGTTATTSFTDTGLSPATAYTYTVKAHDAAGNTSAASAPVTVTTLPSSTTGLVLDDFDGNPAYPSAARNDLGKWTGGNCFGNGGGSGVVSGGALALRYANCGWFGSDVHTDLSAYTHLVVRIKGAAGGEQSHFSLGLGGTTKVFGDFTLDGGGHPAITTAYQDIRIPLAANGISRSAPGQLAMGFWYGGNSTVTIDSLTFQ